MPRCGAIAGPGIFVCGGGVFENSDDLMFGQNFAIIQGEQQGLADRKGSKSSNVGDNWHWVLTFYREPLGLSCKQATVDIFAGKSNDVLICISVCRGRL